MTQQSFHRFNVWVFAALVLACGLSGCRPTHPLNQKISANSLVDHNLWRARVQSSLSQEQWADFDEAIQELRLKIMAEKVATLSRDVDEALWLKIHQRPLCEVMQEGFQFKLARLTAEREELAKVLAMNATLRTKRGDTASSDFLKNLRQDEANQIAALDGKIAKVQEQLPKYDPAVCSKSQGK